MANLFTREPSLPGGLAKDYSHYFAIDSVGCLRTMLGAHRPHRRSLNQPQIMATQPSSTRLHGGLVVLFGMAFLAPGMFMSWLYFAGFAKWWSARQWVEVPCWIEAAELRVSHSKSTSYQATASYRYVYQDHTYHGTRVGFSTGSDNVGSFQQRVHRELMQFTTPRQHDAERDPSRTGTKPFRCYVNPALPEDAVLYRDLRWEMQAFMAIFALTFPAVGAGVVIGGLVSSRQQRARKQLVATQPDAPRQWRPEWTSGPIPERSSGLRGALFAYTIWAGLVVLPLLGCTWLSGAFQRENTPWLLLIFLVLWCLPAWFSWRRLRQHLVIGKAQFELKQTPASPGGTLTGDIMLEKPAPSLTGGTVELLCERKTTTRTGSKSYTTTATVWSHQEPLALELVSRELTGCRVPVQFGIPGDAPPCATTDEGDEGEITWTLKLNVPAKDIRVAFDVPVFRHGNSPPAVTSIVARSIHSDAAVNLPMSLERCRIVAAFDERGLPQRLYCPAARNRAMIGFLLVFVLVWTGAAVFLLKSDAPLLFKIIWPVSSAAIWLIVIWQLLYRRTVTFDAAGLSVLNQLGPYQWCSSFDRNQLLGFSFDSNLISNNTAFYRVRVESVISKKQTLVHGLTDPTTAETLAERMETWRKSG